jgi:hypothetical protein
MNYGITHYFPDGTKENYEAVMAAMNAPYGVVIPKGQLFHAAGPAAGGWLIVAIHDSKASWDKFLADIFYPAMQKGIPGGFTSPPTETTFSVPALHSK